MVRVLGAVGTSVFGILTISRCTMLVSLTRGETRVDVDVVRRELEAGDAHQLRHG